MPARDPDCIFCQIVAHEAPASVVFEDDAAIAFMDIRPVNPGHVLVTPKAHATLLADLPPAIGGRIFSTAMGVAAALRRSGVRCEGVNLYLADGEVAGQEVPHVHVHVIPRFRGDGHGLRFGPGYGRIPEREKLDKIAARVRGAIAIH